MRKKLKIETRQKIIYFVTCFSDLEYVLIRCISEWGELVCGSLDNMGRKLCGGGGWRRCVHPPSNLPRAYEDVSVGGGFIRNIPVSWFWVSEQLKIGKLMKFLFIREVLECLPSPQKTDRSQIMHFDLHLYRGREGKYQAF